MEEERQDQNDARLQPAAGPEKKAEADCMEKVQAIMLKFNNSVEEVKSLKLILDTILSMRVAIRDFPGCKPLDENFLEAENSIKQRVAEIEVFLKALAEEGETLTDFMKQTPEGGVQ
jgi:hypothetical protein